MSGWTFGARCFAGYLTGKALSTDNLFVVPIIRCGFAVPKEHEQMVLMIGVIIAIVLRGIFIAVGAALIDAFSWIFCVSDAWLLVLAGFLGVEWAPEIPIWVSLTFIGATVAVATVVSLIATRGEGNDTTTHADAAESVKDA